MWVVHNLLQRFEADKVELSGEMRQDAITAALLHDLGHGPLSHVFENLTNHRFDHEAMTQQIILKGPLKEKIARPDKVAGLLKGVVPAKDSWVRDMLSGPLDADKMDYLLRDSHYTGTDYGLYDYDRLFQSLIVYERVGNRRLGVMDKGLSAAEAFILARDRMYWSVYYHKTTRGVENVLISILARVKDLIDTEKAPHLEPVFQKVFKGESLLPDDMADFDDLTFHTHLRSWRRSDDTILADLCHRYFDRVPFKAEELSGEQVKVYAQEKSKVEEAVRKIGLDPAYYCRLDYTEAYPYAPGFSDVEGQVVIVETDKAGEVKSLKEITAGSRVIRLLRDEHKESSRIHSTPEGLKAIMEAMKAGAGGSISAAEPGS